MIFYLGVHRDNWLKMTDVPLFVSHRVLRKRKTLPKARGRWALDSGGFSELSLYGYWKTTPEEYAAAVMRYVVGIGNLDAASIQDWMCEPVMLKKTGKTIEEHQRLTIASYLRLRELAPAAPWMPVLQGWHLADYLRHLEMYAEAGVDLRAFPLVGVGSICRRQATDEAAEILRAIADRGIAVHAFGLKTLGVRQVASVIASSDSMAWSLNARKNPPLEGCTHMNCANCLRYALRWRERVLDVVAAGTRSAA